jgi:hypothetical protein
MDKYPLMLYRFPGTVPLQEGLFATHVVENASEHKAAIADGWHEGSDEAKAAHETAKTSKRSSAPTREELEHKATELSIPFDARVSDKKLGELIAEKLKA